LLLLTLAFYNPVVHNGFTNLDDEIYIVHNPHVLAGLTWETVKWAFTAFDAANWHPLTWLSHALDCQLFGLNPVGHHYVTVLLHATNALLLFLLLESATGLTWPSFMVAALFALHPVNVESVAWAAERKNVLSMLFFLLTLLAYGWYVRRGGAKRYAAVAVLFALGLMAKPEVITLPFVLLLWDNWPLQRMFRQNIGENVAGIVVPRSFTYLFVEKIPLFLLSAASAIITLLAQRAGHAVRVASDRVRLGNAAVAYVRYLGKAFWPARLAAVYPHPEGSLPAWQIVGSIALLLAITVLVLYRGDRRYLAVGWFWFLGTLVPVIGLVQVGVQAMADRYAYIPYIGLFVFAVWGLAEIAQERKITQAWLAMPAILILLTLGVATRRQIAYWHDSESLWRHTLNVTEHNYMAHDGLARTLAREGRTDEALAEFNSAESIAVYLPSALLDIGLYAQSNGRAKDALGQFQQALDASKDAKSRTLALNYLAAAFTQIGDFSRAKASYNNALQQDPENTSALIGSALLAERDGDLQFAIAQISLAMKIEPTDVGYLLLAQALRRNVRPLEANDAMAKAQRISPNVAHAQQSAAQILTSFGIQTN
jgi:tetratricopeptide (TPR) repeat protein